MAAGRPCWDYRTISQGRVLRKRARAPFCNRAAAGCLPQARAVLCAAGGQVRHGAHHQQANSRALASVQTRTRRLQRTAKKRSTSPSSQELRGPARDWTPPPHLRVGNQAKSRASVLARSHNTCLTPPQGSRHTGRGPAHPLLQLLPRPPIFTLPLVKPYITKNTRKKLCKEIT